MENFVQAIEGSAVNEWIMGSYWAWPAMEVMHFIGLSLLLGALLVIDLRLAGFFSQDQYCRDTQIVAVGVRRFRY